MEVNESKKNQQIFILLLRKVTSGSARGRGLKPEGPLDCRSSRVRHETHPFLPYYWQSSHQALAYDREFKVKSTSILLKSPWKMEIRNNFSSAKDETTNSLSVSTSLDKREPGQAQSLIICFSAPSYFTPSSILEDAAGSIQHTSTWQCRCKLVRASWPHLYPI